MATDARPKRSPAHNLEAARREMVLSDPGVQEAITRFDEVKFGNCRVCNFISLRGDGWCHEHREDKS